MVLSLSLAILLCLGLAAQARSRPHLRVYWIQAEEILWDYAPSYPINPMMGHPFGSEEKIFVEPGVDRIGHIYKKAVFRSYSPNFASILDGPHGLGGTQDDQALAAPIRASGSRQQHLGNLGPILRAEVGDTIVVHLRNATRFPVSLHPHGLLYTKSNEGSAYADDSGRAERADDAVPPGSSHTYAWSVPERAGPGPADPDSIAWPYHSHVSEVADTNAGLIGAIVIHRKGNLDERRGLPKRVDREFVNLYAISDENQSLFIDVNIRKFLGEAAVDKIDKDNEDFIESNLMHGINGYVYADLPGLTMRQGEHVRWYLMAMGTETDIHTPHWHGSTLLENGRRLDTTEVFPSSTKTLDMQPDVPGVWMMHCHVNDHLVAGMQALFTVRPG